MAKKYHPVINQAFLKGVSTSPGVYLMSDRAGTVIYVGKAGNLRRRLTSYARWDGASHNKTTVLLSRLVRVETIITHTEKEALILEASLIKKHRPRYNVILRDDKTYPYIKISIDEQWPRLLVTRRRLADGARYFGPYSSASSMWATVKLINNLFPLRRCKKKKISSRSRPCLNHQMKRCLAPCMGKVDSDQYRQMVDGVIMVLEGRSQQLKKSLEARMAGLAERQEFEEAARCRDQIKALGRTLEKQVVAGGMVDTDIFALVRSGVSVAISVLVLRRGAIIGHRSFFLAAPLGSDDEVLAASVCRYYDDGNEVPRQLLLGRETADDELITQWLTERRAAAVTVKVPRRGNGFRLMEMARANGRQVFADRERKEKSWEVLAASLVETLHLTRSPELIECLDISNIGGQHAIGSLVAFKKGVKAKANYRHYRIRTIEGPDDYGMMAEVLQRRFQRGLEKEDLPDLLLVDGGKGQLGVARRLLADFNLSSRVELAGIAKEKEDEGEKLYRPGRKNPLVLPFHSPILLFLMKVRDESHRFGITFHRELRRKKTLRSELDRIPGVGPSRKKQLLKNLGSLKRVRQATIEQLVAVPGVGPELAAVIHRHLNLSADKGN